MIVSLEMSPENMRDRIFTMLGSGIFRASDLSKGDINIDDFRSLLSYDRTVTGARDRASPVAGRRFVVVSCLSVWHGATRARSFVCGSYVSN
jgi:hypothetical protein